jgi:hypothetical protein
MKPEITSKQQLYERAQRKVEEIKSFYTHLVIYLIFAMIFVILNLRSTSYPWAIFPIVGWGLGVLAHAAGVFGWNPFFNRRWEQREIEKIMRREQQNN